MDTMKSHPYAGPALPFSIRHNTVLFDIYDVTGSKVSNSGGDGFPPSNVVKANAEYIVHACNLHAELVATLRFALDSGDEVEAERMVRAVLAKAENRA